jgi:hypothetical protein
MLEAEAEVEDCLVVLRVRLALVVEMVVVETQVQQIQAGAVVVKRLVIPLAAAQAVLVLSLSVTPTRLIALWIQQAHQHSLTLAVLKYIHGQVLVQLLSKVAHGTFCTT